MDVHPTKNGIYRYWPIAMWEMVMAIKPGFWVASSLPPEAPETIWVTTSHSWQQIPELNGIPNEFLNLIYRRTAQTKPSFSHGSIHCPFLGVCNIKGDQITIHFEAVAAPIIPLSAACPGLCSPWCNFRRDVQSIQHRQHITWHIWDGTGVSFWDHSHASDLVIMWSRDI